MSSAVSNSLSHSFLESRLQRAYQRINANWFPVNDALLERVKRGLLEGHYDLDIEFLITEIKTDFALFTFCLRESLQHLRSTGQTLPPEANPSELFRAVGFPFLKKILLSEEKRISTHDLERSSSLQSDRLREAMISASAAEVLAEAHALPAEEGFSTALLRQLGLALIAWNYPTVYERSYPHHTKGIEISLTETLGFSPAVLASYVISQWGMSREMQNLVRGGNSDNGVGALSESGSALRKICEVGEALARADNPHLYPTAEEDWSLARDAIERVVGPEGIRTIQTRIEKNCEGYRRDFPTAFSTTAEFDPRAKILRYNENKLLASNPIVRGCAPAVRKALKALYASMSSSGISPHCLREIAHKVWPIAGFSGGCVYVLDPSTAQFVPRLKAGELRLRATAVISASAHRVQNDPVVIAFDCNTPMIEHAKDEGENAVACIAAGLGTRNRIGVLYLEIDQRLLDEPEENVLTHFKAIRRALEDALRLD